MNTIKKVSEQLLDESSEIIAKDLSAQLEPSAQAVFAAAEKVINYAGILQSEWNAANKIAQSVGQDEDPLQKVIQFQRRMITTNEQYKQMMANVLELQNVINTFLGQRIQMVYVWVGSKGKVELYTFDNDVEHLKIDKASTSHGGQISGRINNMRKEGGKKFLNENYDPDKSLLNPTFKEVHERAKESKIQAKKMDLNMGGAFYIYWKDGGEWIGARVTGMGALAESYFGFYINEVTFQSFIEAAVGKYMTDEQFGVLQGDAVSGFLRGDVSKDGVEYGVKSAGASAMGYSDIIDYAQDIIKLEKSAQALYSYLVGDDGQGGLRQALEGDDSKKNLARMLLAEEIQGEIHQNILAEFNKKGKGNVKAQFNVFK
jgi:hypothetical protein